MGKNGIGIGFVGILTLCLLFLKAFNIIKIGWWAVFAPIWITALVIITILIIILIFIIIAAILD